MALRIPRFDRTVPLVDEKGLPTIVFHQWWDSVAKAIEQSINDIQDALAAAGIALAAAAAAQTAADNAQTAADTVAATVAGLDIPPTGSQTVTANYAVTGTDSIINVDATAGMVVITLLGAASPYPVTVKKIDASGNAVRLAAQAGETVNGGPTFDFTTTGETHVCTSNGIDEWYA